jgi:hypothetical protein
MATAALANKPMVRGMDDFTSRCLAHPMRDDQPGHHDVMLAQREMGTWYSR